MTDKQKAEEIACRILSKDEQSESYSVLVCALMEMAYWKDSELLKQHQKEVKRLSDHLLDKDYPMCP